jgi:lysophospholipase L1-like esterase
MVRFFKYLVVAFSFFSFCHGYTTDKVGIIGDSVGVDFHNFLEGRAFPIILQERLAPKNILVVNDCVSATLTCTGVTRINQMIANHWPQVIFIGLASNDIFRFLSVTDMQFHLETMFQIAEHFQIQVILGKVDLKAYIGKENFGCCSPTFYNPQYIEKVELMYKTLEERYPNVIFSPYLTVGLVNGPGLTFDYIHASALGHEVLTDYVEAAILAAFKIRKYRWGY